MSGYKRSGSLTSDSELRTISYVDLEADTIGCGAPNEQSRGWKVMTTSYTSCPAPETSGSSSPGSPMPLCDDTTCIQHLNFYPNLLSVDLSLDTVEGLPGPAAPDLHQSLDFRQLPGNQPFSPWCSPAITAISPRVPVSDFGHLSLFITFATASPVAIA
ncbi:unnamed protein product [Protopolystoma xenopodis]|uniref:Uncharacterized protein n=1 Tax=Protopolystoma xenopodis TaxID=117903 RepID=A0A3S5BX28_9PLAT|nr:unnamed protein product [Protopolystoma xenopodis]